MWSVKDKAMVHNVRVSAVDLEKNQAMTEDLPTSFQPDLVRLMSLDSCVAGSVKSANEIELQSKPSSGKIAMSTITDDSVFHCEYYLTNVRSESEQSAANIIPSQQPYLKFGRPDLAKIFTQVAELCTKDSIGRVAVVTCGPLAMTQEVQKFCSMSNTAKVKFDVHVEEFDF